MFRETLVFRAKIET